jgi:hypothetical protein
MRQSIRLPRPAEEEEFANPLSIVLTSESRRDQAPELEVVPPPIKFHSSCDMNHHEMDVDAVSEFTSSKSLF